MVKASRVFFSCSCFVFFFYECFRRCLLCLQEIFEYLHPDTGIADLAAEGSVHGGGELGGGPGPDDDLEGGGGGGQGLPSADARVDGGQVVHVDASESLSAATGELRALLGRSYHVARHRTAAVVGLPPPMHEFSTLGCPLPPLLPQAGTWAASWLCSWST